jgi:site-specific recombinase XerD
MAVTVASPHWLDSGVRSMTPYQNRLTAITERMAGDMKIRHLAPATIDAYTDHAGKFAEFLGKRLQQATPEDVRNFQLHLIEQRKVGWSSFNQAVCALRFLYTITLPKPWPVAMIPFGKRPRRLPTVLSVEEVDTLLSCTPNLKHRTFLMTLYAAGLRLSEAAALKIPDIDSQRMQLRVVRGKGNKQRLVPLSPRLLCELRTYWKQYRPSQCLFPGKTPNRPYASTSIQKAIKAAARRAKIQKNVTRLVRQRYSLAATNLARTTGRRIESARGQPPPEGDKVQRPIYPSASYRRIDRNSFRFVSFALIA